MGNALLSHAARGCASFARSSLIRTLSLAIAALPALANAQTRYAWELWGSEISRETGAFSSDATSIGATYYFDGVEDGGEPYALSEFFDPTTRLSAVGNHPSGDTNPFDPDSWTVSGRYLLAGSRWYVGGQYTRDDISLFDADSHGYGLSVGKYLGPRTTLELAIDKRNLQYVQDILLCPPPACSPLSVELTTKTDIARLSFFHVRHFRDLTYTLSGGFSRQQAHQNWTDVTSVPNVNLVDENGGRFRTYSFQTALYPTNKLGVNLGYQTNTATGYEGGYSVGARWFFRRNVAFELSLLREEHDAPPGWDTTIDTRTFRITGRF